MKKKQHGMRIYIQFGNINLRDWTKTLIRKFKSIEQK